MAAKAHAILSASSSDRWLHSPPSARICETYEDKGSDYAAEGTDAHALGEYKLKTALGLPSEDPTDSLKWYSEEMEDATSGYAEYVLEQIEAAKETCADPVVLIEQRVDFSRWGRTVLRNRLLRHHCRRYAPGDRLQARLRRLSLRRGEPADAVMPSALWSFSMTFTTSIRFP